MRKIALFMGLTDYYEHGIARGVVRYARAHPEWSLFGLGWMFRGLEDISKWRGDGIVARVEDSSTADTLAALGIPVVDVAGGYGRPRFSKVTNDDFLTGYNAALHLLGCGLGRFAFLGVSGTDWSALRRSGFERAIADRAGRPGAAGGPRGSGPLRGPRGPGAAGGSRSRAGAGGAGNAGAAAASRRGRPEIAGGCGDGCGGDGDGSCGGDRGGNYGYGGGHRRGSARREAEAAEPEGWRATFPSFELSLPRWERWGGSGREAEMDRRALEAFLSSLSRPVGLFACNDTTGLRAAELAGRLGIEVPESMAILGVDNEDILCELASPGLSSIMLDCEAIGYRAAETLDALLDGTAKPGSSVAVPPKEVAERASTRIYACDDEIVARAASFIRSKAREGIDVSDVLAVVPASRRTLEKRFKAELGLGVHEEIVRVRIGLAKRLLRDSDRTIESVAAEAGFGTVQRFHELFREQVGSPPGEWRRQARAGAQGLAEEASGGRRGR